MKKCFILGITVLVLLASIRNVPCATEHRIALVIGNSEYRHSRSLINPANDAFDMARALETCGFSVSILLDATRSDMLNAIRKFGKQINYRDCVGLFYFSGHGVQVKNVNYLVPVDVGMEHENEVEDYCVKASAVLRKMETASNKLNIIILDACRNNPLVGTSRTSRQGLAQETAPPGSLIAFATAPNTTASDGFGLKNSPYTASLLKHLVEPGLPILSLFNKVGNEVKETSGGEQVPWFHTSPLPEDFTFVAGASPSIERSSSGSEVGVLRVETEPSGAEVWLGDRREGKTPLVIKALAEGRVQVEVKLEGYRAGKETVLVRPGKDVTVRLLLDPLIATGTLIVKSEPSGAAWYLDGALAGKSPDEMRDVKEGRHEILVTKEGYKEYRNTVFIKAGERTTVEAMLEREKKKTNSIGQEFVLIPSGTYTIGSPPDEKDRHIDETQHEVTITKPFYLQTTEVTQGQWKAVMGNNPSHFNNCGADCPVENVSWEDAQEFIRRLNQEEVNGKYRLPTEAEWEYACRSGSKTMFCFGNREARLGAYGWYSDNSRGKTHPVGRKLSNSWGLFDMAGNVWEWCQDVYSDSAYTGDGRTDPLYTGRGSLRVVRGGSWYFYAGGCRSANRNKFEPSFRFDGLGFRLARSF